MAQFFAYLPFPIFQKIYLAVTKNLEQIFAYPLFKYLKKHTCKSENT